MFKIQIQDGREAPKNPIKLKKKTVTKVDTSARITKKLRI